MSRSRKKHYSGWTTAKSEKFDKQKWHRGYRKKISQIMLAKTRGCVDTDNIIFPLVRVFINVWCMHKDGRQYYDHPIAYRK